MKISFNGARDLFNSAISAIPPRFKPVVYTVSAVALALLVFQCCRFIKKTCFKKWGVKLVGEKNLPFVPKEKVTFDYLVKNSNDFSDNFPTEANLMKNFAKTDQLKAEVVEHATMTHPLLHERLWSFIPQFLDFKKNHGSDIEKKIYKDMTPTEFVDRLIKKRPLAFFNPYDTYLLKNGKQDAGGFEEIGTDEEDKDLSLENYQSYFEMSLAAFISMVVPTHFINQGDRYNKGIPTADELHESKGIYVGMVGARFEKSGLMEFAHMIVTPHQNTSENGYGNATNPSDPKTKELRIWAELYQSKMGNDYALPDFNDAKADTTGRFYPVGKTAYLDTFVYKEHLKMILEGFLLESNEQAQKQNKKAYLHLVGLGLGAWGIDPYQGDLILEVYSDLLKKHQLNNISDLDFSYFPCEDEHCGGVGDQEIFDNQGNPIKIHFSKREPAEKLVGEDEGKLLIAQYAWDSNSYPGNEYWLGKLTDSGDPAAACCSMIPELQNPDINPFVQAKNLTVLPAPPKDAAKSTSYAGKIKALKLPW